MKKIAIPFIALLLLMSSMSFAQVKNVRLGLTASPSFAWFKPETREYKSEGLRLGFTYGLVSDFALGEHYAFSTGLNIAYIGGRLSYPDRQTINDVTTDGISERIYKLQYLQIPMTIKMHTREIGYTTYYARFGFGPAVNLRARANEKFDANNSNLTISSDDLDIKSQIPFFRVSLIMGLGAEYSLGGNAALFGGLTFNNGFTNVLKGSNKITGRKQQSVANLLEVSVGIMF